MLRLPLRWSLLEHSHRHTIGYILLKPVGLSVAQWLQAPGFQKQQYASHFVKFDNQNGGKIFREKVRVPVEAPASKVTARTSASSFPVLQYI
eukprot:scaffold9864_cov71-Cyclotella_meneghiniana.AAC.9